MFCSNCGNKLADGAKFCSFCGNRVKDSAETEFRFGERGMFEEPKTDSGAAAVKTKEERPTFSMESVSFDWSNVMDEPHKKEIPDVRSPWATTGGIDEKELYSEMTPSTDRSRTMSFIDVLKAEKEEKEKKAEERAFVYTEVLEMDPDLTPFNDAPKMHYAPLYEDVDEPVKTPFDDIPRPAKPVFDNKKEPTIETSRETIAQFDEYVKSFEAGAGIIHDEPRFEEPAPKKEEPEFDLPDFLRRGTAPVEAAPADEPRFEEQRFEAPKVEEPEFEAPAREPEFEIPKFDEPEYEEPVFEEPKYEEPVFDEPAFEEPKYEEGSDDDDMEDLYLDLDTGKSETQEDLGAITGRYARLRFDDEPEMPEEDEPVDEKALFEEMKETKPEKKGMTIAPPADKEAEIEALKRKIAELMGEEAAKEPPQEAVSLDEIAKPEKTEDKYLEPEKPAEEMTLEPETTKDLDGYFDSLVSKSEAAKESAPITDELLVLDDVEPEPAPAAETKAEPTVVEEVAVEETVVEEAVAEPAPAEETKVEPAVVEEVAAEETVVEEVIAEPAPAPEAAAEPAPAEEAKAEPAVEEAPAPAAEAPAEEPKAAKASDALSLEELEKDLFGEDLSAEAEAEETKKIDKFYTLYRKNEEFQRLLDEEYDKLKGEAPAEAAKPAAEKAPEAAVEQAAPAEDSKAYRQIEDETIYKAFEIPPELVKAPPKEVPAAAAAAPAEGKRPVEAEKAGTVYKKEDQKAALKAEKAKARAEKKAAKAKAKAEAAASGVEYEEVDTGSGFLTVLAVIIAIILVILLAVILILQVAPDSGIAIAIDSLIENLTGGLAAVDPGSGQFLL